MSSSKIDKLKAGVIPIWEPGLEPIVTRNVAEGRLRFTTDVEEAVKHAEVQFIAVGTPPDEDGSADLQYVLAVAESIARHMPRYRVIVNNSTVPVGTADKVQARIEQVLAERGEAIPFDVVSNPEFLKEGAAVGDFLKPDRIVISPGPCTPNEAGVSLEVLEKLAGQVPILGVCLGHQSLGQAFGGKVVRARTIMHGKTSPIRHKGVGVFAGLPDPFEATRYHSLVVERSSLPDALEVTAWTENEDGSFEEIMGLRHREYPVEGVQFHPESILTEHGHALLKNFLER